MKPFFMRATPRRIGKAMNVLVTGASGFVAGYLIPVLRQAGHRVIGCGREDPVQTMDGHVKMDRLPERRDDWQTLMDDHKVEAVVHLAAQSHVPTSWHDPAETMRSNILPLAALLEAAEEVSGLRSVVSVGSGEEYGPQTVSPVTEAACAAPANPYAVSKLTASQLVRLWGARSGVPYRVYHVRPFNHVGPGQQPGFVVPDLCRQIVEVERGGLPRIAVGNLAAVRDFLDVRDVVRAYALLLEGTAASGVYNVASGQGLSIAEVLRILVEAAMVPIEVVVDPARFRPLDVPEFVGSSEKLRAATGWTPQYAVTDTLAATLAWWRARERER